MGFLAIGLTAILVVYGLIAYITYQYHFSDNKENWSWTYITNKFYKVYSEITKSQNGLRNNLKT